MPDAGDVLDGYRLDAVIGRGGMGTVYRAQDTALEKTVALKVIAPHLADDATFVQRFREEAKALARLDADGIVDVYAMRETDDALFFVMEHLEGPSLQTVLRRQGALNPSAALSLLRQILEAVGHAHASGVLHRDLKPSNILLDSDERAVITDFGLAKILASDAELTATHEQLGTVAYMSPEQVQGLQNVTPASDLFSVGLIAYETFTGRLPFDRSESDFVIQRALVEEAFPPPSTFEPKVPPSVEQVVLNLLAKDPNDRPPDAQTVLNRLPALGADEAPSLLPSGTDTAASTLTMPQWLGLAAAVVLTLMGTYAGVRATLGLPILSVAPPAPPDTMRVGPTTTQATQQEASAQPSDETGAVRTPRNDSNVPPIDPGAEDTSQAADPSPPSNTDPTASSTSSPASETADAGAPSDLPASSSPSPSTASNSPAPSPPRHGVLVVRSQPNSVAVRISDSLVGQTPLMVDSVEPGPRRITLQRREYRRLETSITVEAGDTLTLAPTLTPRPAVVRLQVNPSGELAINGTSRTVGPDGAVVDSLPPGSHRLSVTSPLGRWETELQLEAGERYQRTVDFTQHVDLAVTARSSDASPLPNATVRVDGEPVGYTPQRLTLRVGLHTFQIEKANYQSATREVLVDPDMDSPLVFELSPETE